MEVCLHICLASCTHYNTKFKEKHSGKVRNTLLVPVTIAPSENLYL